MVFIHFSSIFMVFIIFLKGMATAESTEYCSHYSTQFLKLSIFDLGEAQFSRTLYLNITEFENRSVGDFLNYLKTVQQMPLSSNVVSVKTLNVTQNVSPFSITPLTTPLCRAIDVSYSLSYADRQYTLFVGSELSPSQALMRRFLKGLRVDDKTGLFEMGDLSPVIFDKSSQPTEKLPKTSIAIEMRVIETVYSMKSTTSSINKVSPEISALIVTEGAKYSKKQRSTSNDLIKAKKAVVSLLNKKTEVSVDKNAIELDPLFIEKLYEIVDNINIALYSRTEQVVKLLNRYGWYVPSHFVLGGRLDIVKPLDGSSSASYEKSVLEDLAGKLSVAYNSISTNTSSFFSSNERITSTVDQATDIPSFVQNVQMKENWRIIELKNIVPTCQLLLKKHSNLMAEIRRLIVSKSHLSRIQLLQPNIDMLKYVNDIWSDYIVPF